MWSDIDYLDNYRDFTYDPIRYAGLPQYIEELHNKSMRYVPIIDAGIAMRPL
jgi:alpha-glucosidase (family GH31 glycosyl hydrolase)